MPRRKTISEPALLAVLLDEIAETGPDGLTFARAAACSGLSAPTLVQRFGDRAAMVEAILMFAWDRLDEATEAADAAFPVSPRGAIDLLLHLTPDAEHGLDGGLPLLREAISACEKAEDFVTRDLLVKFLEDQEEHVDWLETEQWQIENVGMQNYIQSRSGDGD